MCYDLTISRIGTFVAFSDAFNESVFNGGNSPMEKWAERSGLQADLPHDFVLGKLLTQLGNEIITSSSYKLAWDGLAKAFDLKDGFQPKPGIEQLFVRPLTDNSSRSDHVKFACVLPGKVATVELDGIKWKVSARASFTACVIEEDGRSAKLWWNFTAVPEVNDEAKVDGAAVASILSEFEKHAVCASANLHQSYQSTIESLVGQQQNLSARKVEWENIEGKITINFSDNDHATMQAFLLKALADGRRATKDRAIQAEKGEEEFREFVSHQFAEKPRFDANTIELALDAPDTIGFMFREENQETGTIKLVGFARRPYSLSPVDDDDVELREIAPYVQSAARPLSAFIANREANRFC